MDSNAFTPQMPPLDDLIDAAVRAPSADNNQPWHFQITSPTSVHFELDPARALRSDVHQMFDLTSLGAAIENFCIAASWHGWQATSENANVSLQVGGQPDELFPCIADRHTNRQVYQKTPLTTTDTNPLTREAERFSTVRTSWFTARQQISQLAWLIAEGDYIRFQQRSFHTELFEQLRLSHDHARQSQDGLRLETLALPPGGRLALHFLKSWRRLLAARRAGLLQLLRLPTWRTVRNSGAIVAIYVAEPGEANLIAGGRAFQRMWLAATRAGLSIQPLGSLPIFFAKMRHEPSSLDARIQHRLTHLYAAFTATHSPPRDFPFLQMLFRIGRAKPVKHRSLRRPASIAGLTMDRETSETIGSDCEPAAQIVS